MIFDLGISLLYIFYRIFNKIKISAVKARRMQLFKMFVHLWETPEKES